jgi:uncharacterized protein (TIGR00255 family)
MTHSMTAFARCESRDALGELIWEIRSVNHRYLEPGVRLPDELRMMETAVRELLGGRLSRGKLDCTLRYRPGAAGQPAIQVNQPVVDGLIAAADDISTRLQTTLQPLGLIDVLQWPGVVEQTRPDMTPLIRQAMALLEQTLDELLDNRQREGARLAQLIVQRCQAMREQVQQVRQLMPQVLQGLRQRLRERMDEIAAELDPARLEQEMVMLTQRLDVDEEMDRLLTHLDEVEAVTGRDEPVGRRLDFLMQELNREANTLGSKSSDVQVTQCSVEMKVLIEQMREQVQNIE